MLGHLSFGVRDLDASVSFYDAALAPLGLVLVWRSGRGAGYGPPGGEDILALFQEPGAHPPGPGFHLAFDAPDRTAVDRFHAAALSKGGRDQGPPGLRPQYHAHYYAAFVLDPDGHKLEAVHQPRRSD
ncbi:VOC family protein [Aerophototrophica crusticola]|uniref:VOC family protein n=1 Tax=Aerophototrophica crusticola TaxID=1709002 RepID=A0A858R3U0_9PROT|nr:VOC family protein [Rhodospirillaceae bacterium B3]